MAKGKGNKAGDDVGLLLDTMIGGMSKMGKGYDPKVAKTVLKNGVVVSTVKLHVDHGHGGTPMWYETMVFACDKSGDVTDWVDLYCKRYTTEDEAKTGHEYVILLFDEMVDPIKESENV